MRLIDADKLIKSLDFLYKNGVPIDLNAKQVLTKIMEQPTVDTGQIRADCIEECIAEINKLNIEIAYPHTICNILEQLKENKR